MKREKCTIGITGGIGSGKSYISAMLHREFGVPVYDCDKEAKRLTASDEEIRRQLIKLVGPEVYDGQMLNRQCLADYLFSDPEHAKKVNAIIHPAVLKDFTQWAETQEGTVVALESAILYESGFSKLVDYVLFVDASEDVRLQRAMQRDAAAEAQIRMRMKMQQPEQNRQLSDFVIDNSVSDDIRLQVLLKSILQKIK